MASAIKTPEGFEAIGKPIPFERRQHAYEAIRKDMVPDATVEEAMSLVNRVADRLERDQPYDALKEATDAPVGPPPPTGRVDMEAGAIDMGEANPPASRPIGGLQLDYTGAIRLFAHLLA